MDSDDDAEEGVNVSPSTGSIFTLIAAVIVTLVCWFVYIFYGKLQGVVAFIGGFFLMIQVFSFDIESSPQSSSREQRDELGMTKKEKILSGKVLREQLESSRLQAKLQRETERVESELLSAETEKASEHIERGELKEAREILARRTASKSRDRKEAADSQVNDRTLRSLAHALQSQDATLKEIKQSLSRNDSSKADSQEGDHK